MKRTKCTLMTAMLLSTVLAAEAQSLDTVRRKDPGGWEFQQVVRGKNVLAEGYRLNGVPEGTWIGYWESSGYPQIITNYKNGQLSGTRMQISAQGYTEQIENYRNGMLDGPKRVYQPGSQFIAEEIYYSEGRQHGSYNKRYPGGKPQEESNFNNGQRDGKTTWYYETGEKAAEYNYRNGVIDGEVASYHKNGKVNEFGLYKDNAQTGTWKEFYENGSLKAEGKYVNGNKEGIWKQYDENGKPLKPVKYKAGEEVK